MRYILTLESLDDERQELPFDTVDDAVKHAVEWFVEGYNNETIDAATRIKVAEDAVELAHDLREGREFYCSRFYEKAQLRAVEQVANAKAED